MSKVITGFHAIEERILSLSKKSSDIDPKNYQICYSKPGPRVKKIIAAAKEAGVKITQVDDNKLDELVSGLDKTLRDHRGIVLTIVGEQQEAANLVDFDAWIKANSSVEAGAGVPTGTGTPTGDSADSSAGASTGASDKDQYKTVVILDRVTDPHNVGAIIRSCDQFGASLVVIPEHNSANDIQTNDVIARSSAGASAWVPFAIVNNLVRAVEKLKTAGFWIYGADAGGETCGKIDFAKKSVIVMGSEGTGISQLLEKQCDTIVSIPTCGKIDSLNVSVAAGVLLYELFRRQN